MALSSFLAQRTKTCVSWKHFFLGNFNIIATQKWVYPYSHLWSICIEEHFYLIWPFLISFVPVKRLLNVFLGLILLSISFRMWAWSSYDNGWYYVFTHTLSRMDILVIGAIGGYYHAQNPIVFCLTRIQRWLIFGVLILSLCIEPVVAWDTLFDVAFKKYIYISLFTILMLDFLLIQLIIISWRIRAFYIILEKFPMGFTCSGMCSCY